VTAEGQVGDNGGHHSVIGRELQIVHACLRWLGDHRSTGSSTGS
jgi:hypothetical protein